MDHAVRIPLVNASGGAHANRPDTVRVRLDDLHEGRDRLFRSGEIRWDRPTLANGEIFSEDRPLNARPADINTKKLVHPFSFIYMPPV